VGDLTILRGDNREEHTFTAIRDVIEVNTVSYEMKEDNIGYIYVSGFEKVTTHQFEEALNVLQASGMESLVIDLRDNPGGNLSTVCEMADIILLNVILLFYFKCLFCTFLLSYSFSYYSCSYKHYSHHSYCHVYKVWYAFFFTDNTITHRYCFRHDFYICNLLYQL